MDHLKTVKLSVCSTLGAIGAFISSIYGGWDSALTTLVIFMAIDFLSGLIVAAVFKKSNKSQTGSLDSKAGWKGISKKGMILLIVLIAYRLDLMVGSTFIKDTVIIAYIVNEGVSIIENAGLMGLPIPAVIANAIEVLRQGKEKPKGGDET
ncbi:MAG TPA: holin [Clostridiales bacterium]|nr:holin [Clostridiales bacterium]